jgi:ribosome maturation factor RimP
LELQLWVEAVGKTAAVELKIKRPMRRFWEGKILEKKNRA